jgi:hypothetical protein
MSYSIKDTALEYIDYGLNIIPVKVDKTPAITSWKKYQQEKINFDEFISLTKTKEALGQVQGIALITGQISGITVIDFDNGSEDIFKGIETPTVQTGGGGKHYYFKYTEKISQGHNATLHIDVRNDGGYALMPPSITNKGSYFWIKDLKTPLAELPQDFINLYSKNIVKKVLDFSGAVEGSRNQTAVSVVGKLVANFRHDLDLAWVSFKSWNDRNTPPLPDEELKTIFNWCVNLDTKNNPIKKEHIDKHLYEMEDEELIAIEEREVLTTGVLELDNQFKHPAGFYVICANPGVGKGWWALWLSRMFYLNHKVKSVYFSLEMPLNLIKPRIIQQWSDLTEQEFKSAIAFKENHKFEKAIKMLKEDMFRVDEFGGSDTSKVKPEVFKKKIEDYYKQGFRVFHFDHLHELEGANDNTKNQGVTEIWAKTFQGICKDYPDIWLFVFAQPNGSSANKKILKRTDIAGSKAITQKCEFFYSLNRTVEFDEETKLTKVSDDREVIVFLDKNRISSAQYVGFRLYFMTNGNFIAKSQIDNLSGFFR